MQSQISEENFEEIVQSNKDQVYRICWGFSKNSFDADDLFQEVMINIWKGVNGFKGNSMISTWIYRITVNTCLLWKRKSQKEISYRKEIERPISTATEYNFEIDLQIKRMQSAIQKLKKVDRTLILLVLEECSYKEIAEITGLTVSNVGVKIGRIKARIKQIMQNK